MSGIAFTEQQPRMMQQQQQRRPQAPQQQQQQQHPPAQQAPLAPRWAPHFNARPAFGAPWMSHPRQYNQQQPPVTRHVTQQAPYHQAQPPQQFLQLAAQGVPQVQHLLHHMRLGRHMQQQQQYAHQMYHQQQQHQHQPQSQSQPPQTLEQAMPHEPGPGPSQQAVSPASSRDQHTDPRGWYAHSPPQVGKPVPPLMDPPSTQAMPSMASMSSMPAMGVLPKLDDTLAKTVQQASLPMLLATQPPSLFECTPSLTFGQRTVQDPEAMTEDELERGDLTLEEPRTVTITNTTPQPLTVLSIAAYARDLPVEWDATVLPCDLDPNESLQVTFRLQYPYKEPDEAPLDTTAALPPLFEGTPPPWVLDRMQLGIKAGFIAVHAVTCTDVLLGTSPALLHTRAIPFSVCFFEDVPVSLDLFAMEHVPTHLQALTTVHIPQRIQLQRSAIRNIPDSRTFDPYRFLDHHITEDAVNDALARLTFLVTQQSSHHPTGAELAALCTRLRATLVLEEEKHQSQMQQQARFNPQFEIVGEEDDGTGGGGADADKLDDLDGDPGRPLHVDVCVPGLRDSRPRLLVGDVIRLRFAPHVPEFTAVVIGRVRRRMSEDEPPQVWGVRFVVSQQARAFLRMPEAAMVFSHHAYPFSLMNAALQDYESIPPNLLLPQPEATAVLREQDLCSPMELLDERVNQEQQLAVRAVLTRSRRLVSGSVKDLPPLVIHGPPGTGKTLTLVECIRQLLLDYDMRSHKRRKHRKPRILAVAPSNTAADIIVDRLSNTEAAYPSTNILRVNWYQRDQASMDPRLSATFAVPSACSAGYELPSAERLKQARVVVCTCDIVGHLSHITGDAHPMQGFFTDILFDEAAQAMEPEAWIVLRLASAATNVVVAGDHCQLGPLVRSPEADRGGLGKSWQERLLELPAYADCTNPLFKTTLLRNFRSHESLLSVPSELFYQRDLMHCARPATTHAAINWEQLQRRDNPLLFWGVDGAMQTDYQSGSLTNPAEAEHIAKLVRSLVQDPNVSIAPDEVGVIAPFRHQVALIRTRLRRIGLRTVDVGCIEDFQGKERAAIFISTVITPVNIDQGSDLDKAPVLNAVKPFNVAITRAQALLVVVGHAARLYEIGHWRYLLNHIKCKGTLKGTLCEELEPEVSLGAGRRINRDPILNHDIDDDDDDDVVGM
ncbi:hypothetical protein PTSG_05603 [Salpingoeca rosetta]|uniref:Uncharacterized protein n=1 Tax=Salpingoeca rosetta (strain ATCC 50818 / BSB-021) TaxID=946362 RepID=F2UBP1_SALR5|nr:uncharacterized protein PTSG_05603 [Salpingoeca rosetta]EGD73907.1 hypothetical protein PTSG_05603 [Salpingoeca rosetta]|eukprot:XP_004993470.1 hypothetical protein PTSG_05603 [Salpingoeca rosetta]